MQLCFVWIMMGIINFYSLIYFDDWSIESLPSTYKEKISAIIDDPEASITAETSVSCANISLIAIRRLIVVVQAAKHYTLISRTINATNMHYTNLLSNFKIDWDTYEELNKENDPYVPLIIDKDYYRKETKRVSIFIDWLSWIYGYRRRLFYVIQEPIVVPSEIDDPLDADLYHRGSGNVHEEMVSSLSHNGPIYKHDNTSVYNNIEKAARGASVESTFKSIYHCEDERGAFLDLFRIMQVIPSIVQYSRSV